MISSTPAAIAGSILPLNAIDLTKYTKFCWEDLQSGYVTGGSGVVIPNGKNSKHDTLTYIRIQQKTHIEIDISNISGSKYLGILNVHSFSDASSCNLRTDRM